MRSPHHLGLVNSDIARFIRAMRYVVTKFPFYDEHADLSGRTLAGNEIAAGLKEIDPLSMKGESFWTTFVDDVKVGDYYQSIVLRQ
jgi:SUKH-4 immunity protein of toxin-antitoxin system